MTSVEKFSVRADDGHIIHADSRGTGPAIVFCNGLACTDHFWTFMRQYFSDRYRLIQWDYRAHGRTAVPADLSTMTIHQAVQDLRSVLDQLDVDQAVLIGHSMGCQVILEAYAQFPERVAGLVPILGTYGRPGDTVMDSPVAPVVFPVLLNLMKRLQGPVGRFNRAFSSSRLVFPFASSTGLIDGKLADRELMAGYFEHLANLDVPAFLALTESAAWHSAEDVLIQIGVPTLVVGADNDVLTPVWLSRQMHNRIPDSELTIIPGGSHAALAEHPEFLNLRLDKFFADRQPWKSSQAPGSRSPAKPGGKRASDPKPARKKKAASKRSAATKKTAAGSKTKRSNKSGTRKKAAGK